MHYFLSFQTVARILGHATLPGSTVLHSSKAKHNKFHSHNLEGSNLRNTFPSNYKPAAVSGGARGALNLEVLLTLFQPELRGQIMSTTLLLAPPDLKT